jgi:hypothetical protein
MKGQVLRLPLLPLHMQCCEAASAVAAATAGQLILTKQLDFVLVPANIGCRTRFKGADPYAGS